MCDVYIIYIYTYIYVYYKKVCILIFIIICTLYHNYVYYIIEIVSTCIIIYNQYFLVRMIIFWITRIAYGANKWYRLKSDLSRYDRM